MLDWSYQCVLAQSHKQMHLQPFVVAVNREQKAEDVHSVIQKESKDEIRMRWAELKK